MPPIKSQNKSFLVYFPPADRPKRADLFLCCDGSSLLKAPAVEAYFLT